MQSLVTRKPNGINLSYYALNSRSAWMSHMVICNVSKGQLISKCPFGVFKSPKKPTKCFPGFLPWPLKRGQIKKVE